MPGLRRSARNSHHGFCGSCREETTVSVSTALRRATTVLEMALSTYEMIVSWACFGYDIKEKKLYGVIFFKGSDSLAPNVGDSDFKSFLSDQEEFLISHPLMAVNAVLDYVQRRAKILLGGELPIYECQPCLA